jgi:hypothetical protein
MDRNFLAGRHGDAANAVLAAVSCNFSRCGGLSIFCVPGSGHSPQTPVGKLKRYWLCERGVLHGRRLQVTSLARNIKLAMFEGGGEQIHLSIGHPNDGREGNLPPSADSRANFGDNVRRLVLL